MSITANLQTRQSKEMKALLEPIKEIARFDELFRDLKKEPQV